ncbi:MAG: MerR family transcriptional regulator [Pseudomonadota bacterium]
MDNKGPDAFRTISEVAGDLDLPQHVLRFWETRFSQIKPMKRGGGRRYYRPDDVELLRGIRHLLYDEGYTIKGVQRILKERGVRFVSEAMQGADAPAEAISDEAPAPVSPSHVTEEAPVARSQEPRQEAGPRPSQGPTAAPGANGAAPAPSAQAPERPAAARPVERPAPTQAEAEPLDEETPKDILLDDPPDRKPDSRRLIDKIRGVPDTASASDPETASASLSRDDIRRLQSTLFELLECKRILDRARSD